MALSGPSEAGAISGTATNGVSPKSGSTNVARGGAQGGRNHPFADHAVDGRSIGVSLSDFLRR